jgi:alpha-mannosidase
VLPGLQLRPGTPTVLETEIDLPDHVAGVPTAGDSVDLLVNSVHPICLSVDGRPVLEEARPVVALGPALVELAPAGRPHRPVTVRLEVRTADHRVPSIDPRLVPPSPWLHVSTPGLRRRFDALDAAWAELALAHAVATTPGQREAVAAAAGRIPTALPSDDAQLVAVVQHMESALAPLSPQVRRVTVHAIGHSHIDLAWLWTWPEAMEVIRRDASNVLALMDEFPELTFTQSQPAGYEALRERDPDLFARVLEHIRAGRWEAATMQWVESDTNLIAGEAMARQLFEGVRYSRAVLGRDPTVFLAPDTFGHAGTVPQLAVSAGARAYYHHRCAPGGPGDRWPAYWWEGDDGSRVLGVTTPAYYGDLTAGEVAVAAIDALAHGHVDALLPHGVCDHGGGPTRVALLRRRRLAQRPLLPVVECSTVARYADAIMQGPGAGSLPVHTGESALTFRGCYTSHVESKVRNRRGENALLTADTLAALAGLPTPPAQVAAWRSVLFHQFHDILGGSSIADVYDDQAQAAKVVEAAAGDLVDAALDALEAGLRDDVTAATNPLAWERVAVVDIEGRPAAVRLPGFGTVAMGSTSHGGGDDRGGERGSLAVEETATTITVGDGRSSAVVDRASGSVIFPHMFPDAAGGPLNVLRLVREQAVPMSAWDTGPLALDQPLTHGAEVGVVEAAPARVVIEAAHAFGTSTAVLRIRFETGRPGFGVDATIDWRERGGPDIGIPGLKVGFAGPGDAEAWYESPFGATRRDRDGSEVPALRWAALARTDAAAGGFAVLNDGRHGYSSSPDDLRLTLVRSPYEPDPEADLGEHRCGYWYFPFSGDWRQAGLARAAAECNQPPVVRAPRRRTPLTAASCALPRLRIDADPSLVVATLKPAHDGHGAIVRVYDSAGVGGAAHLSGLAAGAVVCRTTIVEDPLERVEVAGGAASVVLRPFEVVTLLVTVE